jgi:predicted RNase H-like HicB family nuclease
MKFKVVLYETQEGFAVFCPSLHGCVSQGETQEEALSNMQSAIREYLEVVWIVAKENIESDTKEDPSIKVSYADLKVNTKGVEEAEEVEVVG